MIDMFRIREKTTTPLYDRLSLVLFLGLTVAILATFRDYGYSWDETWQNRWYGQAVIDFFASFGSDRAATNSFNFYLYGGTFDTIAELLVTISPFEPRNTRHLANALAGLAGIVACWRMARHLGGPPAGFWAALFLAVSAPWYGHMFINAKDIPFAAGFAWALYFLLRTVEAFPKPPLKYRICLGITTGLTLGVRIGGVLIFFYLLVALGVYLGGCLRRRDRVQQVLISGGAVLRSCIPVFVTAYLLMLLCWPAAILQPIGAPLAALRAANHFDYHRPILWCGEVLWPDQLPWSYLPVIYAVQLPELLTILCTLAVLWGLVRTLREQSVAPGGGGTVWLLLVATLFPVLWAIANRSTLYDNGRHFLFVLPALMCLAGLCWSELLERAMRWQRLSAVLLATLLLAGLSVAVTRMAALHPYQYAYLNRFAGGMPAGGSRFETDYLITSYREAAYAMIAHAQGVAKAQGREFLAMEFSVAIVGPPETLVEMLPVNFTLIQEGPGVPVDYQIATSRWDFDQSRPEWPLVAEVGRAGMRFAVVRANPELVKMVRTMER